jgi:hypothetical protein
MAHPFQQVNKNVMTTFQEDIQNARKWVDKNKIDLIYPTESREELD